MRVLTTGGAGFVGGNLGGELAGRHPGWELVALGCRGGSPRTRGARPQRLVSLAVG